MRKFLLVALLMLLIGLFVASAGRAGRRLPHQWPLCASPDSTIIKKATGLWSGAQLGDNQVTIYKGYPGDNEYYLISTFYIGMSGLVDGVVETETVYMVSFNTNVGAATYDYAGRHQQTTATTATSGVWLPKDFLILGSQVDSFDIVIHNRGGAFAMVRYNMVLEKYSF